MGAHDAKVAGLLTAKELAARLKVGRSTLYRHVSTGRVPEPLKLGGATRWRAEEIADWIAAGCPPRNRWEWEGGEQ
ncbi:MAG: helix-turn-helix transcriptional regulator [Planctomycetota bacterium]